MKNPNFQGNSRRTANSERTRGERGTLLASRPGTPATLGAYKKRACPRSWPLSLQPDPKGAGRYPKPQKDRGEKEGLSRSSCNNKSRRAQPRTLRKTNVIQSKGTPSARAGVGGRTSRSTGPQQTSFSKPTGNRLAMCCFNDNRGPTRWKRMGSNRETLRRTLLLERRLGWTFISPGRPPQSPAGL